MKILFDYDIFLRQKFGGISRYFYELITRASNYDEISIDLFMGVNNSGYFFKKDEIKISLKDYKVAGADKLHFLFNILNEKLFYKHSLNSGCDLMHKTYYSDIGLSLKLKKVITVHDMTHELLPRYFAKSDTTSELKRKCIEEADAIICVSQTTKNDLLSLFPFNDKKLKVIYHGININSSSFKMKYIDEPYILYVGQRWGYKNFNSLLSVYNLSEKIKNNYKLICFGGGDFNFSEKLYINKNKLSSKVIYVSGDDYLLGNLYTNAELFVYTSLYEGFGFPPLEAMACNCPVLASSVASVKEIVEDAALFFDPLNIEELHNNLSLVLEDSNLRSELIKKGHERVMLFSWDYCVKEHIKFYKEII